MSWRLSYRYIGYSAKLTSIQYIVKSVPVVKMSVPSVTASATASSESGVIVNTPGQVNKTTTFRNYVRFTHSDCATTQKKDTLNIHAMRKERYSGLI